MQIGHPRLIGEFLSRHDIELTFVKRGSISYDQANEIHLLVKGEPLDRAVLPLGRKKTVNLDSNSKAKL